MRVSRPWVKWRPSDFLSEVADLTPNEIAVYAVVLNCIYDNGGAIQMDCGRIARRCNMRPTSCKKTINALIEGGKLRLDDGLLFNDRAAQDVESRQKISKKQAINAHTRWQKVGKKVNEINAHAVESHCQTDAKPMPENKGADEIRAAVDLWNEFAEAEGLPRAQRITAARKAKIKARLNDCGGLDGWKTALEKVRGSPGLLGRVGGNWKASLDFLLQESSFTKLMEGIYDGWTSKNWGSGPSGVIEAGRKAEEIVKRIDPNGIKY